MTIQSHKWCNINVKSSPLFEHTLRLVDSHIAGSHLFRYIFVDDDNSHILHLIFVASNK